MHWSFLEDLKPSETYYGENIKSTNFILGTNTKSTNLRIHEIVIFNQTTKIDTHEEKYFHSISFRKPHVIGQKVDMWLWDWNISYVTLQLMKIKVKVIFV
jgi:hypothetical protein